MSDATNPSQHSIIQATRSRAKFSGHKSHGRMAMGAAGYREKSTHPDNCAFLANPGDNISLSPKEAGFESILIGAAWDNTALENKGWFSKLIGKAKNKGVDLDVGCMYELQDGTRGALQAFGQKFGALDEPPFIALSEDERTGNSSGDDEFLMIKGENWQHIRRVVVYIYIYKGAARWSDIKPQLAIDIPGEDDLYVTLNAHQDTLPLCAVGELENIRGGIRLTNRTEYFPGHEEMDRAFGFGLDWGDGKKE